MNSVTHYYGIAGTVEFLDVAVDQDNRLFVDPSRIRNQQASDPYARHAYGLLVSYFDEVLRCINSSARADHRKGELLLQQFSEPNETRLGMSKVGVRGHGGSDGVGSDIWAELVNDPLCKQDIAVLKFVEDLPVFIDGVDADITSDVTTRIVMPALADFTTAMMAKHPEFTATGHRTGTFDFKMWDSTTNTWSTASYNLPIAAGKALVLVPKAWVGRSLLMRYGQFHQRILLRRLQEERRTCDARRNRHTMPYKKSLAAQERFRRSRQTCITQTERVFHDGEDLIARYRQDADDRALPLTDEELAYYLHS